MDKQADIIAQFKKAQVAYETAEDEMKLFFREKHKLQIDAAKTPADFIAIKEQLREMPECAGKVLIFRTLLLKEMEVNIKQEKI